MKIYMTKRLLNLFYFHFKGNYINQGNIYWEINNGNLTLNIYTPWKCQNDVNKFLKNHTHALYTQKRAKTNFSEKNKFVNTVA